jgi:hypothetical protein
MIKVRKVLYTSKGYIKGEYLGAFEGDIENVYEMFSRKWMDQNSNGSEMGDHISDSDVDYVDEFTYCDEDSFCIGVRNGTMYEGIASSYEVYPGGVADQYGFEQMADTDGNIIKYTKSMQGA